MRVRERARTREREKENAQSKISKANNVQNLKAFRDISKYKCVRNVIFVPILPDFDWGHI